MKKIDSARPLLALALLLSAFGIANAQIQAAGGGYYVAGYGRVHGSFGQASVAQSRLYDKMKSQSVESSAASNSGTLPPVAPKNLGVFRPDTTVDSASTLAIALGETIEEKALVKQIYKVTKDPYEVEAASRGWKNNIAAGLTFFTVTAMTVYHDSEEPSDDAVVNYFSAVNIALDEIPEFGKIANKDKQGFNNILVGFSGMLHATYTEAKQTNNAEALDTSKKLAAMLIEMVWKTNPENLQLEDGQIVMK